KKRTVSQKDEEQEVFVLDTTTKQFLFDELNLKGNLTASRVLTSMGHKSSGYELNYTVLEGNRTNKDLYNAYLKILDLEGYDVKDLLKVKSNKDEVALDDMDIPAAEIKKMVQQIFETLGIDTAVL